MYYFYSRESYEAIKTWLEILGEYDENYLKASIANFKTRKIMQHATSTGRIAPAAPKDEISASTFRLDTSLAEENPELAGQPDLHVLELYNIMEQSAPYISSLYEGLENLSDKINTFIAEDDDDTGLIEFFK